MASPIRPQFFCSRPNGTLTPLIALDELPAHVAVRGIPRILSAGDTQGMTSLGTVHPRAQYYVVDGVSTTTPPRGSSSGGGQQTNARSPQSDLQTSLLKVVADDSLPASQRLALHAFIQQSLGQNQVVSAGPVGPWSASNGHGSHGNGHAGHRQVQSRRCVCAARRRPLINVQIQHQNPKKEFCSYWIRHGECDYQQQGCLYKHEMPTDPGMLEKLGLRDIPRWYREKYGIPSLLSGAGHLPRSYAGNGQHWKEETQDRGSCKAIQYSMTGTPDIVPEAAAENGVSRSRAPTYSQAVQQHSIWGQGSSRPAFAAGQPSTLMHRNGARQIANGHNSSSTGRKVDLLSFDPMADYIPFDGAGASLGEVSYPTGQVRAPTRGAEHVQHDGFIHHLHSSVPVTGPGNNVDAFLTVPCYDSAPSPSRNKRTQRSRRLYQARSHTQIPDKELQPAANDVPILPARSSNNNNTNAKTGNGAVFSVTNTKCSNGSTTTAAATSPISSGGPVGSSRMSPGSPSFDESPSVKSHVSSSSGSANLSPDTARLFNSNGNGSCSFKEREVNGAKSTPGVIGTRKAVHHSESVDDLIGLGLGRGK